MLQWAVLLPMTDVIAALDNCIWLMLSPSGWYYYHCEYSSCLADVITKVVDGMPTIGCGMADVVAKVADGIATGSIF